MHWLVRRHTRPLNLTLFMALAGLVALSFAVGAPHARR